MIHGVPVQVLPAYNALAIDAVQNARVHDYEGVGVRVVDPEHLVALALQVGGARRRERAWLLLQSGTSLASGSERSWGSTPSRPTFQTMSSRRIPVEETLHQRRRQWHDAQARLPLPEKVRHARGWSA